MTLSFNWNIVENICRGLMYKKKKLHVYKLSMLEICWTKREIQKGQALQKEKREHTCTNKQTAEQQQQKQKENNNTSS